MESNLGCINSKKEGPFRWREHLRGEGSVGVEERQGRRRGQRRLRKACRPVQWEALGGQVPLMLFGRGLTRRPSSRKKTLQEADWGRWERGRVTQ